MSQRINKINIDVGYNAYDTLINTTVEVLDKINSEYFNFWICKRLDKEEIIICDENNLKDFYVYI